MKETTEKHKQHLRNWYKKNREYHLNRVKDRQKKKEYNAENKNRIRELIVDKIREHNINSIVTLESPDFLFSKLLPDKKIIVWENDAKIIKQMEKKCPKNVELVFGNIGKFGIFNSKADCIYLDFCRTFVKEQSEIIRLKNSLKETKLFVLTLCLRENQFAKGKDSLIFNEGDYQFMLLNKLQTLTKINWKVVYGESYYDTVQMVTIILENPEVRE